MANEPKVLTVTEIIRGNLWALRERNRMDSLSMGSDPLAGRPRDCTWTQADVAVALGVAERTYGSWERDPKELAPDSNAGRRSFKVEELIHLARVLGCDVSTLLQPSQALLRAGAVIEVPSLSGSGEGVLRVSAEDYSLWLSSIQALPEQDAARFDRLASESHDHGTKGDLRTRRTRPHPGDHDDAVDPGRALPRAPSSGSSPTTGWHNIATSIPDAALTRAELARAALWRAREAIRLARMVPNVDSDHGDSPQQALDDALALLDEMGDLLLVIADQGARSNPEGPVS